MQTLRYDVRFQSADRFHQQVSLCQKSRKPTWFIVCFVYIPNTFCELYAIFENVIVIFSLTSNFTLGQLGRRTRPKVKGCIRIHTQ